LHIVIQCESELWEKTTRNYIKKTLFHLLLFYLTCSCLYNHILYTILWQPILHMSALYAGW